MAICTFFGHKNTPQNIEEKLKCEIINLIENLNVNYFLVGNNGMFDNLVIKILSELFENYDIEYNVVLAYLPQNKHIAAKSIMPENFESYPPRFAIDKRNQYMLNKSDFVICYVTHNFGGAAKFVEKAKSQNKKVINIADFIPIP